MSYVPRLGSNGLIQYSNAQEESETERITRERFWRSLGKRIRKNAR